MTFKSNDMKYILHPGDKMKSFVYAFKDGDYIILYGIGGVDAPNVPVLKGKIDNSFINRVTTFCKFIFGKLQ